ncbi:flagellar assembly peptidoglycan hydrolase FlgJ [Motiliproteus coralliicola]|uniref:Peptidoglycan hydrolase FlgJ n=1 Tax=Motiliproteus coralliicola TaxID=2283196 RepID=A0A369WMF9_9GAMM|nr:flagellar assembly peptidoglycan hydrolase FlgJ [Motiliproteus coralliicola]RDE22393.1 flagellar assembly peptidoglycan hydrolase FlgJ [Motiliproteus coralliicola]
MTSNDLSIKSYTDLTELNKLKQANRNDDPRALQAVAEQFESLFLNMLLKNMRQANEAFSEGGLFDSSESKFYQEMMDQQLSMSLSSGKGIGLSEVLVRQLSPNREPVQVDQQKVAQLNQPVSHVTGDLGALLQQARVRSQQQDLSTDKPVDSSQRVGAASTVAAELPDRFESPQEFVQAMMPIAKQVSADSAVEAEVLVAQAALETGWGKHLPRRADGGNSYNLFGIKADQRWQGDRVASNTLEFRDGIAQQERASFRAYDSYRHSMQDYLAFISESPRYQQALGRAGDSHNYIEQLQLAGYATDPAYSSKVQGILNSDLFRNAVSVSHEG